MNNADKELLERFMDKVSSRSKSFIGYPANSDFDYSELYPLLNYCLNNVGDPLVDAHSDMHSKYFERE